MRLANGNIVFTNLNGKSDAYQGKAVRVLALLGDHRDIRTYLGNRNCDIVLERRLAGAPADITENGPVGVSVVLAAYYFENYSIGYVLGMLCHEFGIHHVADSDPQTAADDQAMQGVPVPVPGVGAKTINTVGAVSADHAIGVMPMSVRHDIYRRVVLHMADLLVRQASDHVQGAVAQDVTDLLDCFLMDLASIAATNDHRLQGVPFLIGAQQVRQDIANAYHAYRAPMLVDLTVSPAVRALFPPDRTADGVEQGYVTLMTRAAKGVFSAPSISTT
jgi:hypothetical protein